MPECSHETWPYLHRDKAKDGQTLQVGEETNETIHRDYLQKSSDQMIVCLFNPTDISAADKVD
jgi:hypothetical protein